MYPFNVCFKFVGDGKGAIDSDNDDGDVDEDDEDEHLIVVRVLLYHVVSQLLRTQTVWKDCRFPHPCNLFKLGFHPQEEACLKHTPRVERNILWNPFAIVFRVHTVGGRSLAKQLRLVVYPIICKVFIHPRWLFGISSINSILYISKVWGDASYDHDPSWGPPINQDYRSIGWTLRCLVCWEV